MADLTVTQPVLVGDWSAVSEARSLAVRIAQRAGLSEDLTERIARVATEAATNMVVHAGGGELLARQLAGTPSPGVEILALDRGSGMKNVAECLRDGYSTTGAKGLGLGLLRQLASSFDVYTLPGLGTAVYACVGEEERGPALEWGVVSVALPGEDVCGDDWAVRDDARGAAILVVDGLGHGPHASHAAHVAIQAFQATTIDSPARFLESLDAPLSQTRGAAASIVAIDPARQTLRFAGIGNVGGLIQDRDNKTTGLASLNGTLGHAPSTFREFSYGWDTSKTLILYSDGLSSKWRLDDYPGLLSRCPGLIAGVLYRDFAARRDDVTVLVARDHARRVSP